MEYTNNIGTNIARLRREKGAKQEELAGYVGVSAQAVSKWENGGLPDTDLLPKIADFFGVSVDALFGQSVEDSGDLWNIINDRIHTEDDAIKNALELCHLVNCALANEETPEEFEVEKDTTVIQTSEINGSISRMYRSHDLSYYILHTAAENKEKIFDGANYPALFADLADDNLFTALRYLTNRQSKSDFTANLFTKQIGFSAEESAAVIEKLKKYSLLHSTTVEMDDEEVEMYKFGMGQSFSALLTFAKELPQPKND